MAKLCIIVPRMFFLPHQSAVEQRQPRPGHQQHQRRDTSIHALSPDI